MLTDKKPIDQSAEPSPNPETVTTLAVDIGGSGTKVILLDATGQAISERARLKTPSPATPEAVIEVIVKLAAAQPSFARVSVGFPGVVRHGVIYTAVNLDKTWVEYPLADKLSQRLNRPVKVANDADIQGFGAISGKGVELVVTLGTGFGSALFVNGHLVPNLEMAHHRFRKKESYEEQLGRAALEKVGKEKWNQRLEKAIASLEHLFNYDRLYIGGGEAKRINFTLPDNTTIIPNLLGLLGGIALWQD
ncbi:ROK family protein [Leptolyngbya cf. ectocarpi LEGE 11479]|uniref:ROK family protein n=1 Tax=Leptolyngbya cf. ectocarpi LEGE 11479 TaxID=1828722 RepID=A0A928ZY55_LEPEC|nr:ROK family protein [Leptolyngbya ectocarpi]MBE9069649.1 ROK family protein [Leptolyngbya cf. ectocarpi LEGE 11479]